jgi:hypothetical protein
MEERAQDPVFRENAIGLLREMDEQAENNGFDTWVWKDARLPLTLPFWVQIWEDPIYVVTIRHPAEVALSSAQTEEVDPNDLPFSAGLIYWQYSIYSPLPGITLKRSLSLTINYWMIQHRNAHAFASSWINSVENPRKNLRGV